MDRDAMTDFELLEAWREGDRRAGETLLARHFDMICRFFRRRLGDDVQDIIQRTFLDCIEARDRIEGHSFKAYVFGIARNRLLLHLRAKKRGGRIVDLSVNSIADFATRPSQHVVREQNARMLLSAMQAIPIDQQIVLELTYWEAMRGPEVAQVLGIPANTVRGRLAKARRNLREQLAVMQTSAAPRYMSDSTPVSTPA